MATGAPGTNGVWQYGEDDSEATFSALLNKAASTTDTQIGADRTRLTALEARKLSALVPVIPTGVTQSGGSASHDSTTGLVTYTGVTVFQVNGIFTSGFRNYRIVMDQTQTASNPPLWRAVVGGVVQTANNYYSQEANFNGTGSGIGRQTAESAGRLGYIDANQRGTFQMDVFTPYLSSTDTRFQNYENRGNSSAIIIHFHASQYFVNNQVEGVQISVASGNMTGTFKVYGYN